MTATHPTTRTNRVVLQAVMAPAPFPIRPTVDEITSFDLYDLSRLDLAHVGGIILTGDVDQLYLAEQQARLDRYVADGGRVLVNGHVQRPFLTGLTRWRRVSFNRPDHLRLQRVNEHPVWAGTTPDMFLYSTGAPRPTDPAVLARVGVAGFYGRGYYVDLPEHSTVIHTIGAVDAPVDYEYRLGDGRVLVHGGNDLVQFISLDRGTAHMAEQLRTWLAER